MVNYLGKFSPSLSEKTGALRELLKKDCDWFWGAAQAAEFICLKKMLTETPVLVPYCVDRETMISADSSSFGLGAAVLQKVEDRWRPVAYASRTLNKAESRYAQVEKGALALCWACGKFRYYIAGKEILVETDHKPLLAVLDSKELSKLPPRIQRFRLRMMAFTYKIIYTPGTKLVLADALSRSPVLLDKLRRESLEDALWEMSSIESLPISASRLGRLRAALVADSNSMLLSKYVLEGWPNKREFPRELQPFYNV